MGSMTQLYPGSILFCFCSSAKKCAPGTRGERCSSKNFCEARSASVTKLACPSLVYTFGWAIERTSSPASRRMGSACRASSISSITAPPFTSISPSYCTRVKKETQRETFSLCSHSFHTEFKFPGYPVLTAKGQGRKRPAPQLLALFFIFPSFPLGSCPLGSCFCVSRPCGFPHGGL